MSDINIRCQHVWFTRIIKHLVSPFFFLQISSSFTDPTSVCLASIAAITRQHNAVYHILLVLILQHRLSHNTIAMHDGQYMVLFILV